MKSNIVHGNYALVRYLLLCIHIESKRNGSGIFLPASELLHDNLIPRWRKATPNCCCSEQAHMLGLLYASVYINNENNENFSCKHGNFPICASFFSFGLRLRIWYEPSLQRPQCYCYQMCAHTVKSATLYKYREFKHLKSIGDDSGVLRPQSTLALSLPNGRKWTTKERQSTIEEAEITRYEL